MDHTSLAFRLPDGRTLGYALYGSSSPTASQIIYLHSWPSSRFEGAILASHAVALNIRLICPDRPGIGASTSYPKRKIMDWPADVLALANYLQIPTFSIVAYSGGAPYALACMRELPRNRLRGVDIAAGAFLPKVPAGQQILNMIFKPVQLAVVSGATHLVAASLYSQYGTLARDPDPTKFYAACEKEMPLRPEIERKALEGVEMLVLWEPIREAMRSGVDGSATKREITLEVKLGSEDWGVDLSAGGWDRVTLWHGARDVNCPVVNALHAEKTMGCELRVLEGYGHVGVFHLLWKGDFGARLGKVEVLRKGGRGWLEHKLEMCA